MTASQMLRKEAKYWIVMLFFRLMKVQMTLRCDDDDDEHIPLALYCTGLRNVSLSVYNCGRVVLQSQDPGYLGFRHLSANCSCRCVNLQTLIAFQLCDGMGWISSP